MRSEVDLGVRRQQQIPRVFALVLTVRHPLKKAASAPAELPPHLPTRHIPSMTFMTAALSRPACPQARMRFRASERLRSSVCPAHSPVKYRDNSTGLPAFSRFTHTSF